MKEDKMEENSKKGGTGKMMEDKISKRDGM